MSENAEQKNKELKSEEIILKAKSGMFFLLLNIILMLVSVALIIVGAIWMEAGEHMVLAVTLFVAAIIYICIIGPILLAGLKVLRPNEAYVLTLFGRYYGTLKGAGFYFVNPFVTAVNPAGSPIWLQGKLEPEKRRQVKTRLPL
jgi:ABC-type multidrug transport system fused ATPase/permease subunit